MALKTTFRGAGMGFLALASLLLLAAPLLVGAASANGLLTPTDLLGRSTEQLEQMLATYEQRLEMCQRQAVLHHLKALNARDPDLLALLLGDADAAAKALKQVANLTMTEEQVNQCVSVSRQNIGLIKTEIFRRLSGDFASDAERKKAAALKKKVLDAQKKMQEGNNLVNRLKKDTSRPREANQPLTDDEKSTIQEVLELLTAWQAELDKKRPLTGGGLGGDQ